MNSMKVSMLSRFLKPSPTPDVLADQPASLFTPDGLARFGNYQGYGTAEPYPHLVLDDVFNPEALRAVLREWPEMSTGDSELHNDGTFVRRKFGTTWKTKLGFATNSYLQELSHPAFLIVLQKVTGLSGLLPDPYFFGGGLHATAAGGKLAVHADYNKHPVTKLDRRLNLLIYLNEGWLETNGGCLELWDHEMKKCEKRILPVFNRMVLLSTTSHSFHGQPEPIVGPAGLWRKSIALYYFSNGRPEEPGAGREEHTTLWQERPGQGF
ncbi:MAG: 2OG-Fe(II) oxygenase [Bryobacteraceae bacterium]|jgi:hypothetical protein